MSKPSEDKKSFILYKDFYEPIKSFTNEQLGRLFRAIFLYQIDKTDDVESDVKIAFAFFVNQFKVDEAKYDATCKKNRENALKRWKGDNTDKNSDMRPDTKDADNDTDNDTDNGTDNDTALIFD